MEIKVITFPKPDNPIEKSFTVRVEFQYGTYIKSHFFHYVKGQENNAFEYLIQTLKSLYKESETHR